MTGQPEPTHAFKCAYCTVIFDVSGLGDDPTYADMFPLMDRHYADECVEANPSPRYATQLVEVPDAAPA